MSKCKSDDRLEILEKPMKKKQILLSFYFCCSSTSNKVKNDSKNKESNILFRAKISEIYNCKKNWIKKSLAPFDARIWLQYVKDGEYATNLHCKLHNLESTLKEYSNTDYWIDQLPLVQRN